MNVLARGAVLLAAVFLASCAAPSAVNLAFRETCLLSRYSCAGVPVPTVRVSPIVARAGLYGVYWGGRTVWLSPTLGSDAERYVVMTHEMMHYLQTYADDNGVPFMSNLEKCAYEEEAFEVSNVVARRLNLPDLINLDLAGYNCT